MEEVALSKQLNLPHFREEEKHCISKVLSSSLTARETTLVCVTSGNTLLGSYLVKEPLAHGFLVRVTIENQVDFEDIMALMKDEEMNKLKSVVVAKMQDLASLYHAFRGCHAVFHASSFIDPHGVSGYLEQMAFLETEGARNVMEACGWAAYVKRCIFTSSLLASIWTDNNQDRVINESCWRNEDFCRGSKLWLALGKTTADKVAWRKSKELKVKLVTICLGLLMATSFPYAHKETSLPYLKDVKKVAEAHVCVYKAMDYEAYGRYHCFEKVLESLDEAIQLENELKIHGLLSGGRNGVIPEAIEEIHSKLGTSRLAKLFNQALQGKSCQ